MQEPVGGDKLTVKNSMLGLHIEEKRWYLRTRVTLDSRRVSYKDAGVWAGLDSTFLSTRPNSIDLWRVSYGSSLEGTCHNDANHNTPSDTITFITSL